MDSGQSPSMSLLELAKGLEKLAEAIESESNGERPASFSLPDYGTLGAETHSGSDALTRFLLN